MDKRSNLKAHDESLNLNDDDFSESNYDKSMRGCESGFEEESENE